MTNFIRLTEIYNDRTTLPLILNSAFITSIKKAKQGDTMINMVGSRDPEFKERTVFYFVKETVDEIGAMLCNA